MKLLYSSCDIGVVGLIRGALDGADITYEVRNETIPYPGALFYPEVWVIEDAEFARACELRDAIIKSSPAPESSWTCPSCGEKLEGQFGSCWKCGTNRNVET
jgi:hypothetical protein